MRASPSTETISHWSSCWFNLWDSWWNSCKEQEAMFLSVVAPHLWSLLVQTLFLGWVITSLHCLSCLLLIVQSCPVLWLIRGRSLLSLSLLQLPGCSTASSCCLRVFYIDDVLWAQEEKFLRHLSFRLYVKVIYNLSICVILKFGQSQVFLHILCWLNNTL